MQSYHLHCCCRCVCVCVSQEEEIDGEKELERDPGVCVCVCVIHMRHKLCQQWSMSQYLLSGYNTFFLLSHLWPHLHIEEGKTKKKKKNDTNLQYLKFHQRDKSQF